jgi:hypothetical protein
VDHSSSWSELARPARLGQDELCGLHSLALIFRAGVGFLSHRPFSYSHESVLVCSLGLMIRSLCLLRRFHHHLEGTCKEQVRIVYQKSIRKNFFHLALFRSHLENPTMLRISGILCDSGTSQRGVQKRRQVAYIRSSLRKSFHGIWPLSMNGPEYSRAIGNHGIQEASRQKVRFAHLPE